MKCYNEKKIGKLQEEIQHFIGIKLINIMRINEVLVKNVVVIKYDIIIFKLIYYE